MRATSVGGKKRKRRKSQGRADGPRPASDVGARARRRAARRRARRATKTLRRDARDIGRVVARRGWRARLAVGPAGEGAACGAVLLRPSSVSADAVVVVVGGWTPAAVFRGRPSLLACPGGLLRGFSPRYETAVSAPCGDPLIQPSVVVLEFVYTTRRATTNSTTPTTAKSTPTTTITATSRSRWIHGGRRRRRGRREARRVREHRGRLLRPSWLPGDPSTTCVRAALHLVRRSIASTRARQAGRAARSRGPNLVTSRREGDELCGWCSRRAVRFALGAESSVRRPTAYSTASRRSAPALAATASRAARGVRRRPTREARRRYAR